MYLRLLENNSITVYVQRRDLPISSSATARDEPGNDMEYEMECISTNHQSTEGRWTAKEDPIYVANLARPALDWSASIRSQDRRRLGSIVSKYLRWRGDIDLTIMLEDEIGSVSPVIENLRSEHMATYTPFKSVILISKPLVSQTLHIEIVDLEA